jgi:2-haloacid dehalogenase
MPRRRAARRAELLFVSSNFWDAAGATAFGLRVCWINPGGATPDELGFQPAHVLPSLAQLPALVGG